MRAYFIAKDESRYLQEMLKAAVELFPEYMKNENMSEKKRVGMYHSIQQNLKVRASQLCSVIQEKTILDLPFHSRVSSKHVHLYSNTKTS